LERAGLNAAATPIRLARAPLQMFIASPRSLAARSRHARLRRRFAPTKLRIVSIALAALRRVG
jgi:hypothetical protein